MTSRTTTTRTVAARCSANSSPARLPPYHTRPPGVGSAGGPPATSGACWAVSLTFVPCPHCRAPHAPGGGWLIHPTVMCRRRAWTRAERIHARRRPGHHNADLITPGQAIAPERLMYFCAVLDPSNRDVVFR